MAAFIFGTASVYWVEGYSKHGLADSHSWPEYWRFFWSYPGGILGGILLGGAILGLFFSIVESPKPSRP